MKKSWKNALVFIVSGLVGGLLGFIMIRFIMQPGEKVSYDIPVAYKLSLIPVMVLAFFVVIGVHELGHVMAGKLVNFQFRVLTVGPFMWEKEEEKIRFKWNKNLNAYGGLALCLPQSTQNLVRRFVYFAAGGPLASLLLALVGYAGLQMLVPATPGFANYTIEFFWLLLTLMSAMIFLGTLVPMRAGGFYSDGARILHLLKGGPRAQIDVVTLQAISMGYSGMRPRLQDATAMLQAIDLPVRSPFKLYLHAFLYWHYLDLGQVEQAGAHLEQYTEGLSEIPKGYQAVVHLENTWYEAMHKGDAAKARAYFEQAEAGAFIPKSQRYRAEAGLAYAEGNHALAVEKAKAALQELPKSMDKGSAIAEKEWLEALIAASRQPAVQVLGLREEEAS